MNRDIRWNNGAAVRVEIVVDFVRGDSCERILDVECRITAPGGLPDGMQTVAADAAG